MLTLGVRRLALSHGKQLGIRPLTMGRMCCYEGKPGKVTIIQPAYKGHTCKQQKPAYTGHTCKQQKPTQVFTDVASLIKTCGVFKRPTVFKAPVAKMIRLCSFEELRKLCPPGKKDFCPCPDAPVLSKVQRIKNMIMFVLKLGFVGSILHMQYVEGIWSSSECTADLYGRICKNLVLFFNCKEVPEADVPQLDRQRYSVAQWWNFFVKTFFNTIVVLPRQLTISFKEAWNRPPGPIDEPEDCED